MKVIIKETGKTEELRYFTTNIGQHGLHVDQRNCAYDEVLNNEPEIERDGEGNVILTRAQYSWWSDRLSQQQDIDWRIGELKIEHGAEVINKIVAEAVYGVEFDSQLDAISDALDDFFGQEIWT